MATTTNKTAPDNYQVFIAVIQRSLTGHLVRYLLPVLHRRTARVVKQVHILLCAANNYVQRHLLYIWQHVFHAAPAHVCVRW